jgi:hypothetical protein
MRVFRELSQVLESFRNCMVSLFWSLVMLVFVLYVFALIFLRGFITYLDPNVGDDIIRPRQEIMESFGGVLRTMVSLYMAVTGGNDWVVYYNLVELLGDFYTLMFLFFTFFFAFALFNILTGVFVEKAVVAATPDREELVLEQRRKALKEAEEFRRLCMRLDLDHTGTITQDEFKENMQDGSMVAYMASVGLEVHDVELFFNVIAEEGKEISIDRFVEGCMAMKGVATSLDVQKQIFKTERLADKLESLQQDLRTRTNTILNGLGVPLVPAPAAMSPSAVAPVVPLPNDEQAMLVPLE